jgi:hypothetical protein
MWLPRSFGEAFPAAILSLVCWGSWSNAAKEATGRGVPFPHFYVDWSVGAFVTAVTCWLAMGGAELEAPNNADGEATESVNRWRVASAVGAGTIFNVANALLILGINLAGLSVAFPMGIGTALVLGTTLTYLVESAAGNSPSSAPLLFVGVAVGLLAVVTIAAADWLKRTSRGVAGGYSAIGNVGPAVKKGTKGSTDVEAALASSQKRRGSVQSDESDTDVAVVGGHETPQPPPAAIVEEARISSGGRMKAKIAPPSDATYTPLGVVDEGAAVGPLKAAGVCLLAGLLMSCWGPLSTCASACCADDADLVNTAVWLYPERARVWVYALYRCTRQQQCRQWCTESILDVCALLCGRAHHQPAPLPFVDLPGPSADG